MISRITKTDQINVALNHRLQLCISETRAALNRITILETQLLTYGNHRQNCASKYPKTTSDMPSCDCGWSAVKEQSL